MEAFASEIARFAEAAEASPETLPDNVKWESIKPLQNTRAAKFGTVPVGFPQDGINIFIRGQGGGAKSERQYRYKFCKQTFPAKMFHS